MDPLEYLASYGWMIVIAVAVGALLWSTGVFSPREPSFAREFSKVKILDYSVVQRGSEKTLYLHIAPLDRDYRLVRVEIRDMEGSLLAEMEPRVVIPRMRPYTLEIGLSDHLSDYYRLRVYLVLESLQGIRSGDEGVISGRIVLETEVDMDEKVKADPGDPSAGYLSEKVDNTTLEVDTVRHVLEIKDNAITAEKIAEGVDVSGKGFNADKVDGRDVDDTRTTTSNLWTAQKTHQEIEKLKTLYGIKRAFVTSCYINTRPRFWDDIGRSGRVDIPADTPVLGSGYFFSTSAPDPSHQYYAYIKTPMLAREVNKTSASTDQDEDYFLTWLPPNAHYISPSYTQVSRCRVANGAPEGMASSATYVGEPVSVGDIKVFLADQRIRYLSLTDVGTRAGRAAIPDGAVVYFQVSATLRCDSLCFGYVKTPLGDIPLVSQPDNRWNGISKGSLVLSGILYESRGQSIEYFLDNPGRGNAVLEVGYTILEEA